MQSAVKFEKYSAEQRREMAKRGEALSDGSFPIADKEDLRNALHRVGTTKHPRSTVIAHIRKRAKALGATDMLGEKTAPHAKSSATSQANVNDAAKFSQRTVTPDGKVIRRGKIYEAGPRIDMHGIPFGLTEEELAKIVLDFEPFKEDGKPTIPIGSGHPEAPSPLDGHLGAVTNLFIGEKPNELWAEAEIPPFVDEVLGENAENAKVSALFDRWTKYPIGLDFVSDPNVIDAALTASFAKYAQRHDTPGGKAIMQHIHDAASRGGAMCSNNSAFASRKELNRVQQVHDIACEGGADCRGMEHAPFAKKGKGMDWKGLWSGLFAAARDEGQEVPEEASFSAIATEEKPETATAEATEEAAKAETPAVTEVTTATTATSPNVTTQNVTIPSGTTATVQAPSTSPIVVQPEESDEKESGSMVTSNVSEQELEALRARNLQLEADLNREKAARIENEAVSFANGEIGAHRSLPSEYENLIEMYRQASLDDATIGPIKMADGTQTSRTERLKVQMSQRSEHWMTKELLATAMHPDVVAAAMATAQAGEHKPMDLDTKKKYLEMTDLGRAALQAKYGSN